MSRLKETLLVTRSLSSRSFTYTRRSVSDRWR